MAATKTAAAPRRRVSTSTSPSPSIPPSSAPCWKSGRTEQASAQLPAPRRPASTGATEIAFRRTMPRRLPLALLFAATLLSCHREAPRPRNVIFILVDTLRADRLGTYGYGSSTSPNVDAFAREAVLFADARSQSSCTFPSANSMLTSRWPSAFLDQPGRALGIPE